MQEEFFAKYKGKPDKIKHNLKQWAKRNWSKTKFLWLWKKFYSKTNTDIVLWYYDLISQEIPDKVDELIEDNQEATGTWGIINNILTTLAHALDDDEKLAGNILNNSIDLVKSFDILLSANGDNLPSGNYKETCTDIKYDGVTLKANCLNSSGDKRKESSIIYFSCFGKDKLPVIQNIDGKLECQKVNLSE